MKTQSPDIAIITGISGQDGAYLARLLTEKGYKVIGLIRSYAQSNLFGLEYLGIREKVLLEECDLTDFSQVIKLIREYNPTEIYNLAAQSSVSLSFKQPIGTFHFNTISVFNLLESIKLTNPGIRLYQASTSEMYGRVEKLPIDEQTVFHPISPYAISKAAAHWSCIHYRESYHQFVCCGILFNHESFLRNGNFFVKKVITEALKIKAGKISYMEVGNIDVFRDFGYAPKYVEAMYLMMQQQTPVDYMICSGKSVSLRQVINHIFDLLGISYDRYQIADHLYRPAEITEIFGNPGKARRELGWKYDLSFDQVLEVLIDEELAYDKKSLHP